MKRIALALVGTVAGLAALLSFKSHSAASGGHALPGASLPSSTSSSPAPRSTGRTPTTSTASPPNPGSAATKTVAGPAIQTRYGIVQVQVVVSGQTIKNVSFLQLTADDPRSQEINSQAAPILLQQTLSAQSSQIDGVSGATYTSEGYVESLQSALDQAGIR
jgi:uncharacterized protein with FMN-binding domain